MENLPLSKQNDFLYDPIRKCKVPNLPEERVRQKLIRNMIENWGFPKSMLAVEKELKSLPHLKNDRSNRRLDLICFAKNIHPDFLLFPLLLVECKSAQFSKAAIEQLLGYNHRVKAFFVGVASENKFKTIWYDATKKEYASVDFLPNYSDLLMAVKNG